jgi:hypothetical protein
MSVEYERSAKPNHLWIHMHPDIVFLRDVATTHERAHILKEALAVGV